MSDINPEDEPGIAYVPAERLRKAERDAIERQTIEKIVAWLRKPAILPRQRGSMDEEFDGWAEKLSYVIEAEFLQQTQPEPRRLTVEEVVAWLNENGDTEAARKIWEDHLGPESE